MQIPPRATCCSCLHISYARKKVNCIFTKRLWPLKQWRATGHCLALIHSIRELRLFADFGSRLVVWWHNRGSWRSVFTHKWITFGLSFVVNFEREQCGRSLSVSANGTRIAVGSVSSSRREWARCNCSIGMDQTGSSLASFYGWLPQDKLGAALSLSDDANVVAVGAYYGSDLHAEAGTAQIKRGPNLPDSPWHHQQMVTSWRWKFKGVQWTADHWLLLQIRCLQGSFLGAFWQIRITRIFCCFTSQRVDCQKGQRNIAGMIHGNLSVRFVQWMILFKTLRHHSISSKQELLRCNCPFPTTLVVALHVLHIFLGIAFLRWMNSVVMP